MRSIELKHVKMPQPISKANGGTLILFDPDEDRFNPETMDWQYLSYRDQLRQMLSMPLDPQKGVQEDEHTACTAMLADLKALRDLDIFACSDEWYINHIKPRADAYRVPFVSTEYMEFKTYLRTLGAQKGDPVNNLRSDDSQNGKTKELTLIGKHRRG